MSLYDCFFVVVVSHCFFSLCKFVSLLVVLCLCCHVVSFCGEFLSPCGCFITSCRDFELFVVILCLFSNILSLLLFFPSL